MDSPDPYNRRNLELRAAEYYASIRKPKSEWQSIDDLAPQLTEFEHYILGGNPYSALEVLTMIEHDHLSVWGYYHLLVAMHERLVPLLDLPAFQTANKGNLGLAYYALGQFSQAIATIQQVVDSLHALNQANQEVMWLNHLARAYRSLGEIDIAYQCDQRAVVMAEQVGNRYEQMIALGHIGVVHRDKGNIAQAFHYLEQALNLALEMGAQREVSILYGRLGLAHRDLGQITAAIHAHNKALALARETKYRRYEGTWLGVLGEDYRLLGQFERSIAYHSQSLAIVQELGVRNEEGYQLGSIGIVYHDLGEIEAAIKNHRCALDIVRQTGDRRYEALWLSYLGLDHYAKGELEFAAKYHVQSLKIYEENHNERGVSYALLGLGRTYLVAGDIAVAEAYLTKVPNLSVPWISYRKGLLLSLASLYKRMPPIDTLVATRAECQMLINKEPGLYEAHYVLATTLLLQAVNDPHWTLPESRAALLLPVLGEYRRALNNTTAKGVVSENIQNLVIIRDADIEGLEPVFELLEGALHEQL